MANFAEIDDNNIVIGVIIIDDNDCSGGQYPESEESGQDFINNELKISGVWKQTSFNDNFRYNFAKTGMLFDEERDAFYWKENPDTGYVPPLFFNEGNLKWYWETPNPLAIDENGNQIPSSGDSIAPIINYW